MDMDGSEDAADIRMTPAQSTSNLDRAHAIELSVPEKQNCLYAELDRLLHEVERLRGQQQALLRTPPSNDTRVDDDAEHQESDGSNTKDPDRGRVLHRRPVRLILALVVAAVLCADSLRFWNYLQSTNGPTMRRSTVISIP
jgi:hypothetical protein